jgi:hypothetical protein
LTLRCRCLYCVSCAATYCIDSFGSLRFSSLRISPDSVEGQIARLYFDLLACSNCLLSCFHGLKYLRTVGLQRAAFVVLRVVKAVLSSSKLLTSFHSFQVGLGSLSDFLDQSQSVITAHVLYFSTVGYSVSRGWIVAKLSNSCKPKRGLGKGARKRLRKRSIGAPLTVTQHLPCCHSSQHWP